MTTLTASPPEPSTPQEERTERAAPEVAEIQIRARVDEILSRRPAVGLAVGVVRDGRLELFHGHGLADIASNTPITEDTAFRVASITKLFTAVAVMQLCEHGLVDLDAPATDYLRAYELICTRASWRPPTPRQLLTHTAGVPDVRHVSDLLHAGLSPSDGRPPILSVAFGQRLPSLAAYYRGGLRVVVEPGSAFAYSNHGYATLGQIVEDVSGMPLDRYYRERIFEPLGMADSDLVRSDRIASRLATGYALRRRGPKPVPDRDWIGAGAGGSTRPRAIWPASSRRWSAVAPMSTGASSSAGRSRRCLNPSTSRTRVCRGWVSGSSAAMPPATASSSTTGSCRASTRSSWCRPTTGSASSA